MADQGGPASIPGGVDQAECPLELPTRNHSSPLVDPALADKRDRLAAAPRVSEQRSEFNLVGRDAPVYRKNVLC